MFSDKARRRRVILVNIETSLVFRLGEFRIGTFRLGYPVFVEMKLE